MGLLASFCLSRPYGDLGTILLPQGLSLSVAWRRPVWSVQSQVQLSLLLSLWQSHSDVIRGTWLNLTSALRIGLAALTPWKLFSLDSGLVGEG